ncbi:hypothetical protein E2C01_020978 [Portunus trituberculatus]|uniref:Uncharacterized protein n=1 Tax=Portunus trituberculatus TaxID=210409 RepID=A0A5B7E4V8_PORTR|nr:hypothetical protein [Portunus trituberculatus]
MSYEGPPEKLRPDGTPVCSGQSLRTPFHLVESPQVCCSAEHPSQGSILQVGPHLCLVERQKAMFIQEACNST